MTNQMTPIKNERIKYHIKKKDRYQQEEGHQVIPPQIIVETPPESFYGKN